MACGPMALILTEYDQVVAWVEDHKTNEDAPPEAKEEEEADPLF